MSDSVPLTTAQDEATSEERIQWLRDRGVIIEIPDEKKSSISSKSISASTDKTETITISVVKIPCNIAEPYEEVKVTCIIPSSSSSSAPPDLLLQALKKYFTPVTQDLDESLLKETASKNLHLAGDSKALPDISLSSLKKVMGSEEGAVEAFPLSHPNESNNFSAVNLYLDEVGQLKNLPRNVRAVQLAATCGYDNVPLVGDMYVGRVRRYHGMAVQNMDFTIDELASYAKWLSNIKKENYDAGIARNAVKLSTDDDDSPKTYEDATKGYKWTETNDNIDITFKLPDGLTSKDLKVLFKSKSVEIVKKSDPSSSLLRISLLRGISIDDSTWTGNKSDIEISLEKSSSGLWNRLEAE